MRDVFIDPLNGSDGNDGTTANPLLTLAKWAATAQRGDRVIVRQSGGRDVPGFRCVVPEVQVIADDGFDGVIVPGPGMINAVRIDCPPNTRADNRSLIQGFRIRGGSQAGVFVVCCPLVEVIGNTVTDVGAWGVHVGSSDGAKVNNNTIARVGVQHGIYICNSVTGFEVVGNKVYFAHFIGVHVNGDMQTSRDIGMTAPSGYMRNGLVADNLIYRPGQGGMDADSCEDVTYRNNRVIESQGWGVNVHTSQGNPSKRVRLEGNFIEARWCLNVNNAAEDVAVVGGTLVSASGAFRDSADGDPVRLVYQPSSEVRVSPIPQAERDAIAAAFDPPVPPPPAPAPPPPAVVVLPPFPDAIPAATPVADSSKYDTSGNVFGLLCGEYKSRTHFGPPDAQGVQPPPNAQSYWGSGSQPTPHGFTLPDVGIAFDGVWEPDFTDDIEVFGEGEGFVTGQFAGLTVVSGSPPPGQVARGSVFVRVEEGKLYRYAGGCNSTNGGQAPSFRMLFRRPGDAARREFDALHCFPLKATAPAPVPDPVPDPTKPPTPDPATDPDEVFSPKQWAHLERMAKLFRG